MRPMDNIKKRIKSVPVNTNAERDKEVLDDVLNVLEQSRKAESAACRPNIWRIVMKNSIAKLVAAVLVMALLVGIYQAGGTRAAFARTTKVVSTGLAGLKEFILDMKTREPEPPSSVPPADSSKQEAAFQGRSILANVRTISVEGEQGDLQDFFEREAVEWAPAGNAPNTWYAKLDPGKTARFVELTQAAAGLKLISSPSLMVAEGQEGVIGIVAAEGQDAVALALVGTVLDDGDSIDLRFSFLHGRSGFEIPSLKINIDDAVLFRLVTTAPAQDKQNDQDGPGGQDTMLVLVRTKVFPQT